MPVPVPVPAPRPAPPRTAAPRLQPYIGLHGCHRSSTAAWLGPHPAAPRTLLFLITYAGSGQPGRQAARAGPCVRGPEPREHHQATASSQAASAVSCSAPPPLPRRGHTHACDGVRQASQDTAVLLAVAGRVPPAEGSDGLCSVACTPCAGEVGYTTQARNNQAGRAQMVQASQSCASWTTLVCGCADWRGAHPVWRGLCARAVQNQLSRQGKARHQARPVWPSQRRAATATGFT